MKKLPTTLKLTWHKGYKKDYPKESGAYFVTMQNKKKPYYPTYNFAIFIKETLNGHMYDRWRLLVNSHIYGDMFISSDIDSKVEIIDWAEIKGE